MVSYEFISVESMTIRRDKRLYKLFLVQQPKHSRMCGFGEKVDRRPVDPPPVVKLEVVDSSEDPPLCNPYYFMYATLMSATSNVELHMLRDAKTRSTTGSSVSSLYRLKDNFNKAGFFFVFPDLSIRMEGTYRLKFSLFEIINTDIYYCDSICSDPFDVFTAKKFPGMEESTPLSRVFGEQGLKIRIRKDCRSKKYRNEEFSSKRASAGSNSDMSDDGNSERGSAKKRSKKSLEENSLKGASPAIYYGPPDAYAQNIRMHYPPFGFQRPVYSRDKSQIHPRRDSIQSLPMENMPRLPYQHAYPMMYSFVPRYPYDPYAIRHYDPMMARPYPGYNFQGYPVRKGSNPSEHFPTTEPRSPIVKLEQESSAPRADVETPLAKPALDGSKNASNMSDQNAARPVFDVPSVQSRNSVNGGSSNQELGNSYMYYYPPGAYGYPPADLAFGKRPYAFPPHYAYPVPVNHAGPPGNAPAPPVGYYGSPYHGMYPTPYAPPEVATYPTAMGTSISGNESPQLASYSHNHISPQNGNFQSIISYPPGGIYPPGAHVPAYQYFGQFPQKRSSVSNSQSQDDSRSNSISSAPSGRNSPPPEIKSAIPVDSNSLSNPLGYSAAGKSQTLYSRGPYPQFVSSHSGLINLPPLNILSQNVDMYQKYENGTSTSETSNSQRSEPKREQADPTTRTN